MKTLRASAALLAAVLPASLLALGCPGTLAEKECFLQEARVAAIFKASCLDSGCHNSKDAILGLDLETGGMSKRLIDAKAVCDPMGKAVLIKVGDPESSLLFTKLIDPPPCGSRMPLAKSELYPDEIETIRKWIKGLDGSCSDATSAGGNGGAAGMAGAGGAAGAAGMSGMGGMAGMSSGSGGM